ncbi:MAG: tetratricopeptide repeat protein [Anaerolineales bacterium]|nr:tetratricopeptide repeat protein [Anaerolineales bacterium]
MKITITQTDLNNSGPFAAAVQFDDGPRHPVTISDPFDAKAEGELQWYFEQWLGFPFTDQVRAGRAAATVRTYGESLFGQLFHGDTLFEYKMGLRDGGLATLRLEIRGTPAFHALHWETVWDPQQGQPLAVNCPIIRANDNPPQIHLRPKSSPTLNVLLVVARPGGRGDVGYRTISRPLVEALENSRLPAQIDIVRPGTYAALSKHLDASSSQHGNGYYHIIHFDLHGSLLTWEQYQALEPDQANSHLVYKGYGQPEVEKYDGLKAFLAFNGAREGESDLVLDDTIAHLLQTHQIPIAILNACQSGMQLGAQETSLGSRLMAAGVQSALAMGYSVTVSAAERLMHHLYRHLLAEEPLGQAIRRARLELYNDKQRRATFDQQIMLEDWLLPVVYQNREVVLPLTGFATPEAEAAHWQQQSERFIAPEPAYGFVGRDVDILTVENRLLAADAGNPAANVLLLQGMGGAGKTTLLHHLMQWWQTTRLVDKLFYFGYDEKAYTAAQIVDVVARQLYGLAYVALPEAAQMAKVVHTLCSEHHLLVLDNLESVTGAALAIQHTLNAAEQERLRDFVAKLAGGKTLVLLGSRGREEWLVGQFSKLSIYELPGLDPQAASNLAERILRRLRKAAYASDPAHQQPFQQLLKLLDGHPLALEIVLANLARQTPAELLAAFTEGAEGVDIASDGDLWADKTKSILRCVEYSHSNLSPDAQSLLACLTPFTGVINTNWLTQYTNTLKAQPALAHLPYHQWGTVLQEAMDWGLLTPHEAGGGYLRLQPILPYFLRQRLADPAQAAARAAVETAFRTHYDGIGGALAQLITSKEPQQRQVGQALISLEYENLMTALTVALETSVDFFSLYDALAQHLGRLQSWQPRAELGELVTKFKSKYSKGQLNGQVGANFVVVLDRLANTYLQLKNLKQAAVKYTDALAILEQIENISQKWKAQEKGVIYHQLGRVAEEQRQWETAVSHYQQALAIFIEFNDRYSQASTYHNLGHIAQEQRQWETAVSHYQQALAIFIEFSDRYSQASTYHQLGMVAQEQEKWQEAANYFLQTLEIDLEYKEEQSIRQSFGNLARVWKASGDEAIVGRLAAVLGVSAAEAATLLSQAG